MRMSCRVVLRMLWQAQLSCSCWHETLLVNHHLSLSAVQLGYQSHEMQSLSLNLPDHAELTYLQMQQVFLGQAAPTDQPPASLLYPSATVACTTACYYD